MRAADVHDWLIVRILVTFFGYEYVIPAIYIQL